MNEELDPTTELLVNELSERLLPPLKNALSDIKITPVVENNNNDDEFNKINAEAINKNSEAINKLQGAIKISSDETRAGYEVLMKSVNSIREEIFALRRNDLLTAKTEKNNNALDVEPVINFLNVLDKNFKDFQEEWRNKKDIQIPELVIPEQNLKPVIEIPQLDEIMNALSNLESLIRANDTAHTQELESFLKSTRSLIEQNNLALNHEIKRIITAENENAREKLGMLLRKEFSNYENSIKKLRNIIFISSGVVCVVLGVLILLTR